MICQIVFADASKLQNEQFTRLFSSMGLNMSFQVIFSFAGVWTIWTRKWSNSSMTSHMYLHFIFPRKSTRAVKAEKRFFSSMGANMAYHVSCKNCCVSTVGTVMDLPSSSEVNPSSSSSSLISPLTIQPHLWGMSILLIAQIRQKYLARYKTVSE